MNESSKYFTKRLKKRDPSVRFDTLIIPFFIHWYYTENYLV